jgi:iron complex outermembrane receptor protein
VAGIYYLDTSTPLELDFTLQPPGTPAPIIAFGSPGGVAKHFSEAAFAQVTYAFSPSWSVVVGGRYTEDRLPFNTISDAGGFTFATHTEPTSDKPTGKAAVNWNFTPDSLLYASISSGYKAGGGNLAGPSYEDETNVVTELGLKTTLLDQHLRFTIDGFNSDYQHIQLQQFVNGSPDTTNAAGARFDGGELETTGILGDFRFDGSAAYLHGYFSGPFVYSSNTLPTVAGSPTPYSPTWQFEVGAQYDLHLGSGGKITPRAQWSYQGEQNTIPEFAGQTLPVYNQIQARGMVDLNLTYKALEHWTVAAYALNIGNRVYVANTVSTGLGANALQYGAPRQFGVRATYAFGSTGQ